jgi:hypothetical protein
MNVLIEIDITTLFNLQKHLEFIKHMIRLASLGKIINTSKMFDKITQSLEAYQQSLYDIIFILEKYHESINKKYTIRHYILFAQI